MNITANTYLVSQSSVNVQDNPNSLNNAVHYVNEIKVMNSNNTWNKCSSHIEVTYVFHNQFRWITHRWFQHRTLANFVYKQNSYLLRVLS
jgi:hypothetical protein